MKEVITLMVGREISGDAKPDGVEASGRSCSRFAG